jgi:septal ring factor EnvC (AmiA/AmiB activator)
VAVGVCLAIVVAVVPPRVRAQQPEDAKALSDRAASRIRGLQREVDQLAARARTIFEDLRKLELERAIAQQQVQESDQRLAEVTREREAAVARVATLEEQRTAETPGVEQRLVSIYKRGRGGYVRLLLSSDDPGAFGRLMRGVAAIATLDRVRIESHRRTLEAERAALADVERRHQAVAQSQQAAADARRGLDAAVAARNKAIDALDQRRDLAAGYVAELQAAQAALARTVGAVTAGPGSAPPELPFRPFRGDLDWPAAGRVISRFGPSRDLRFGTSIMRNGIEIGATEGAPARVVHGGTVAYAAPFSGFGTLVIVDHGSGAYTLYGHLADTPVERGMRIARGAAVGTVGVTPLGVPAVYFEVRVDGRPVDPLQWLRSPS